MRIAITGTSKWALQGIAQALQQAGGGALDVRVMAGNDLLASQDLPEVVIAVEADAALATRLAADLPAQVGLLWLGDAPPGTGAARATGHLAADADDAQLLAAVQALSTGLHVRDDAHRFAPIAAAARDSVLSEPLTPRELEVLELMAKGLGNRDIAQALGISSHTAKFHVAQILEKAGAATRTEAVRQALRLGLIGL
jgi:DNA-binding NarL/FixJ family response regulator